MTEGGPLERMDARIRAFEGGIVGGSVGLLVSSLDARSGVRWHADRPLPIASVGKLALLLCVAARIASGELDPARRIDRSSVAPVADSGIWWRLEQRDLSVADLALLVGTASDNLATNCLVEAVGGVEEVARSAAALGVRGVDLHDIVRDERGDAHPPALSTGTAEGCWRLLRDVWRRVGQGDPAASLVQGWMRGGLDLSMVASALGLDSLAHGAPAPAAGERLVLHHKTGTDRGVRADVGVVTGGRTPIVYAAIVGWGAVDGEWRAAEDALGVLRAVGEVVRAAAWHDRGLGGL